MTEVLETMRKAHSPSKYCVYKALEYRHTHMHTHTYNTNPHNKQMAEALSYHASCSTVQGLFRKAESLARESLHHLSTVSVHSRDAQHLYVLIMSSTRLGEVLNSMKRFDDAEATFRATIAQTIRFERIGLYAELSKVLMEKGELVEAEQCILKALELANDEEVRFTWTESQRDLFLIWQHGGWRIYMK